MFILDGVTCGTTTIPQQIADIIKFVYNAIRIAVPLLLVIVGMFEMGKAVTAGKEDEIKKAQGLLVKKAVAAVLVFLMMSLVKMIISVVGGTDTERSCLDQLLNGGKPCDAKLQAAADAICAHSNQKAVCDTSTGQWAGCK